MLNQIVLIGRLTQDPELRYTAGSGVAVASFTLAVNRPFTNQQGERETDFIDIVTWRKLAENCANYLKKGNLAAASGRLQVRSYDDRQGVRRKAAEIVADNVQFLERPRSSNQYESTYEENQNQNQNVDDIEINENDVPF